jgi:ParB family chromosome partitioning protein
MALAQLLEETASRSIVDQLLSDPDFRGADTDVRFTKLFGALSSRRVTKHSGSIWQDPRGRPVVRIERAKAKTKLTFDEKLAPQFGSFVLEKLDELYTSFSAGPSDHATPEFTACSSSRESPHEEF